MRIGNVLDRLIGILIFLTSWESPMTCDLGLFLCYTQILQLSCLTSYNYSVYADNNDYNDTLYIISKHQLCNSLPVRAVLESSSGLFPVVSC